MNDDYVVWLHKIEKNACDLQEFRGFKRSYRLKRGVPLTDAWTEDVEMDMNEDKPDNTLLVDSLFNIKSLLVISKRIKSYLESKDLSGIEFLPVNIKNHKGRDIEEDYFILNLTEHVDCLDSVASQAKLSTMTDNIIAVKGIVLQHTELLQGRKLFRLKGFGEPTLVDTTLAADMDAQGFTGIKWGSLKDFTDKTW